MRRWPFKTVEMKSLALVLLVGILLAAGIVIVASGGGDGAAPVDSFEENTISGETAETVPDSSGRIYIDGLGDFDFDPAAV